MSDSWLSVADALATMQGQIQPVQETEEVHLQDALDRVLAEPVCANMDVPGYDNSAMDGYALRAAEADSDKPLTVVGTALAGHPFNGELPAQSCVRIMTGAQMPVASDAVIMQEQVQREGDLIRCQAPVGTGDNVRLKGCDIRQNDMILQQGQRLTPTHIGLLASLGMDQVRVLRRLRVALFSNGDELVLPGEPLHSPSQIYDSNRFTLHAMLQRLNVDVLDLGLIADDREALENAFQQAMRSADIIISSAGVSVGEADYTKDIMASLGQIGFWKIAMKPGKPFAFGRLGQAWFCGLPGNPVAALVTMDQIVQPMLRHLAGESVTPPVQLQARATSPIKKRPGRMDFQRGRFSQRDGELWAEPVGSQSSAVLTSVAQANCFLVLEQERGPIAAGESITIQPFDCLLT
ncbi:molybdopterin molybdotransferase MoeA [Pseudidiomarina terrestris]|uniref:molybdopterin molybdotransferase MoeA n=1 Tax=Pseudidiomarina terrestris TaxID=2820060 RepID=UPI00264ED788|nr:molybdopterin molybdotransferase MoeA [Pseudidiomarina sp. 1ASP75-5]MDN7136439.1 molybdopterin molybdotransferase MoeA [Pseudidiomarina sp. 1ASP75-5]